MIKKDINRIEAVLPDVLEIAQGGTAVGTGLNTYIGFDKMIAKEISLQTGQHFFTSPNKFDSLASHDPLVQLHGCFNTLAASLHKIGNDIRLLGSGPRCGISELILP